MTDPICLSLYNRFIQQFLCTILESSKVKKSVRSQCQKYTEQKRKRYTCILAKNNSYFISFLNKMILHMKISVFGLHLLETHVQHKR